VWHHRELGIAIKEQSLIIATAKRLVTVAGCAHPRVVNIVKKAKELTSMEVYVLGGFHLVGASENTILSIIEQSGELGVAKVAPCHCSGNRARTLFREEFGKDYIEAGVESGP
jgi:7,8-dihydropterin-6-yl-methyl-4-(beta-D-ribofuranosyl)aminobenzene 5'-phosphate synthase